MPWLKPIFWLVLKIKFRVADLSLVVIIIHISKLIRSYFFQVFQKIRNSTIAYKCLSKVSLNSQLRQALPYDLGITYHFLYELEQDLAENLEKFFQNIPNLKVLKLGGFPDDEIVGQIIPKNCSKLASLTLNLNFSNCVDKRRLTDEGICDYIEDSNKKLQHLDLSQISLAPTLSAKSVIGLYKLEKLTRLQLRNSHFEYIDVFKIKENTSVKSLSVHFELCGEKIDKIIRIVDEIFTKLNKLEFHQISFQNPKNYSNLDLKHISSTLQSFSIAEIINCDSLMNNFPNLEEISCYGCAHPFPQSSKNWPNLKKFSILRDNFDHSILSPNLQKMTHLQNFCIISNDLSIKDVKPHLPLTCNINIETENMIKCSKDDFINY